MVGRLDGGMVVWSTIITHDCAGGMMMTTEDSLQYDENYEGAYEEGYDEGAYYQEDGAGAGAGAGLEGGKVPCEFCLKLIHPSGLSRHKARAHGQQELLPCPTCGKGYKGDANLKEHLRVVHKVYQNKA